MSVNVINKKIYTASQKILRNREDQWRLYQCTNWYLPCASEELYDPQKIIFGILQEKLADRLYSDFCFEIFVIITMDRLNKIKILEI